MVKSGYIKYIPKTVMVEMLGPKDSANIVTKGQRTLVIRVYNLRMVMNGDETSFLHARIKFGK